MEDGVGDIQTAWIPSGFLKFGLGIPMQQIPGDWEEIWEVTCKEPRTTVPDHRQFPRQGASAD